MLVNLDGVPQSDGYTNFVQFNEERGSFMNIEAGISVKIKARYCDFTGFPNKYTHKDSGLRYCEQ